MKVAKKVLAVSFVLVVWLVCYVGFALVWLCRRASQPLKRAGYILGAAAVTVWLLVRHRSNIILG